MHKIKGILELSKKLYSLAHKPIFMFHGTSLNNLESILSQGLIVNPPKKVWEEDLGASFINPSRIVVGGIYFTTDMALAIKAIQNSTKGKEEGILLVSKMDPGGLYADEDDVSKPLSEVKVDGNLYEQGSSKLWVSIYLDVNNEFVNKSKKEYIATSLEKIKKMFKKDIDEDLESNLIKELDSGFQVALKRQVSYISPSIYNNVFTSIYTKSKPFSRTIFNEANVALKGSQPDKVEANSEYRDYLDRVTILCKDIVHVTGTGRSGSDVSFSGDSRIVGIIGIPSCKVLYKSKDGIPKEIIAKIKSNF